jgi:hypothetical protein
MFWNYLAKFLALRPVAALVIWYAQRHPYYHLIGDDGSLYMSRWWFFNRDREDGSKQFPWIPYSIRVHHIHRADLDRWHHNHPGDFRTFILRRWYREHRLVGFKRPHWGFVAFGIKEEILRAGQTSTLAEDEYHTVTEVAEGGVWTLFVMREPRVRKPGSWGFLVHGRYVQWKNYISRRDKA